VKNLITVESFFTSLFLCTLFVFIKKCKNPFYLHCAHNVGEFMYDRVLIYVVCLLYINFLSSFITVFRNVENTEIS